MTGLYVHVPFCKFPKCPYCGFYSVAYDKRTARDYVDACVTNIRNYGIKRFDTVYFGGGTPSLAPEIIEAVMSEIDVAADGEVSVECNPDTVTDELCRRLRDAGVNRVSVGVQSFDDNTLKFLGRGHTAATAAEAVRCAARYFDNISADFILTGRGGGLPSDICGILSHVSAYMLEHWNEPDGDIAADEYLAVCEELETLGFVQYEISNFAKQGRECRHNLNYWRYGDWLGVGAAAHSHIDGKRFWTEPNADDFILRPAEQYLRDDGTEKIFMGLRLTEGIPEKWIDKRKMKSVPKEFLRIRDGRISLTRRGMCVQNTVLSKLI